MHNVKTVKDIKFIRKVDKTVLAATMTLFSGEDKYFPVDFGSTLYIIDTDGEILCED